MMKLDKNEVNIMYQLISQAQILGKDAMVVGNLMEKLQKEMEKLAQ